MMEFVLLIFDSDFVDIYIYLFLKTMYDNVCEKINNLYNFFCYRLLCKKLCKNY